MNLKSVPYWKQLPSKTQSELSEKGYDEKWFAGEGKDDSIRLTVLNLYVKLSGMDLWKYVGKRDTTPKGRLEFIATNVRMLKQELKIRWNFRNPEDSMNKWDSAEKRATGALHFKHFSNWPEGKVQAHIDQAGLWAGNPYLWWANPVTWSRHAVDYLFIDSYQDVFGIRNILLQQGWDPDTLLGISSSRRLE